MKKLGYTVVKNAIANVVRGGATGVIAIALPHFLTRTLDHDRFACWALMLQISAFASYLDFGLQTAVARYLAQARERGDREFRDKLVSTALAILSAAGVLAFLIIAAIVWQLAAIFSHVPASLVAETRGGVLVLAAVSAMLLPMSTFTGMLIGLHKNEYPALAIGGTRLIGGMAVIFASKRTTSLIWLALCLAIPNLLGGLLQLAIALKLVPDIRLRLGNVKREMAAELGRYCSVLTFFSFGMLLITGLDVTIVGLCDFSAVGYYSVASMLIAFFSGLNNAVFGAFIAPVAVLHARQEYGRIEAIIIRATRLNTFASLSILAAAVIFGAPMLRLWVGPTYAVQAFPILLILLAGQAIRLAGNAYVSSLLAIGEQRFAVVPGAIEAVGNLFLSLIGVQLLGPVGVALGTLLAAVLGLSCYFLYTFRKVKLLQVSASHFLHEGVLKPVASFLPVIVCTGLVCRSKVGHGLAAIWAFCFLASAFMFWRSEIAVQARLSPQS